MKLTVIIATMLIAQVPASFFDVFEGALLSVQTGFEKLFNDVVTDVKDTVDCTILAVEHVLAVSAAATTRYYEKCGNGKNGTVVNSQTRGKNIPKEETSVSSKEEYLKKEIPDEINKRVNETLAKFLTGYHIRDRLDDVERELAKETQRLTDLSELVKKELDKLSKEVHVDFNNLERHDTKPSEDIILEKLKLLEVVEQNLKNRSEAKEVHRVIHDVLHELDSIGSLDAAENDRVDKMMKDLKNTSNSSYVDVRKQWTELQEQEAQHLDLIKSKIKKHKQRGKNLDLVQSEKSNKTERTKHNKVINTADNGSMVVNNSLSLSPKPPKPGNEDNTISSNSTKLTIYHKLNDNNITTSPLDRINKTATSVPEITTEEQSPLTIEQYETASDELELPSIDDFNRSTITESHDKPVNEKNEPESKNIEPTQLPSLSTTSLPPLTNETYQDESSDDLMHKVVTTSSTTLTPTTSFINETTNVEVTLSTEPLTPSKIPTEETSTIERVVTGTTSASTENTYDDEDLSRNTSTEEEGDLSLESYLKYFDPGMTAATPSPLVKSKEIKFVLPRESGTKSVRSKKPDDVRTTSQQEMRSGSSVNSRSKKPTIPVNKERGRPSRLMPPLPYFNTPLVPVSRPLRRPIQWRYNKKPFCIRTPNNVNRPPDLLNPVDFTSDVTTQRPVTSPKTSKFDDADDGSFFQTSSKDNPGNKQAARDSQQIIEHSQRAN